MAQDAGQTSIMNKQQFKKGAMIAHDLVVTALAVMAAFYMRFEGEQLVERVQHLPVIITFFVILAGGVYSYFGLYKSKWRFASLPDLFNIFRAVTLLALVMLVADYVLVSRDFYGFFFFGKITIALYWLLQMFLLGGPRLAYRYLKYARSQENRKKEATTSVLLLGKGTDIEVVLRAIEAGTLRKLHPRGILSPRLADQGQSIRGVPVLGALTDLDHVMRDCAERGHIIRRLIATPSALTPDANPDSLLREARQLGIPLARLNTLGDTLRDSEITPVDIEDLILRPTVNVDRERLAAFMQGRRVLVTGGGGSIGSEMCLRAAAFGAREVIVLENAEPALFAITETLLVLENAPVITGVLADIRDKERMREVMATHKPDVVFHAAAYKHVPYLEEYWTEAIRVNVMGSVNVVDAACAAGVSTVVMISTDKAIDPVSMLGVTKRFAEMYAQAQDVQPHTASTRLIAVRFGNVLGSVGSVVPKFKAQIARGGPITVTHKDMVRYFMTVREAADLVLTAASYAEKEGREPIAQNKERPSVFVLKMGQPVNIYELAVRMIRLAGLEPDEDIQVIVTGVRAGERLHEILFARDEPMLETGVDGIMAAKPVFAELESLQGWLTRLQNAAQTHDRASAEAIFEEAIPEFARRRG
jgi:FlaA1/EpsC-like NDP-sugar epimerase